MIVEEAVNIILDYSHKHADDLSVDEFRAFSISIAILNSLTPAERALIDSLISHPGQCKN